MANKVNANRQINRIERVTRWAIHKPDEELISFTAQFPKLCAKTAKAIFRGEQINALHESNLKFFAAIAVLDRRKRNVPWAAFVPTSAQKTKP